MKNHRPTDNYYWSLLRIHTTMKRIVVLASGRGSNFLALARDIREGKIDGRCVALIVDRKGTQAAVRAEEFHIPVSIVDYSCYPSKKRV